MLKKTFITAALALLALPALGQLHPSEIDFPALPDFDTPQAERVQLDNGMVLFLIEDSRLPMINISARIGGGAVFEPADKVGLAGIVGQVMREGGTQNVSGDEMNEILENIAASVETFGGNTSGGAAMFTLSEHLDTVLPLFADVLMNPAFPEDKIELAKTQTRSGISRRNDDPGQIAGREFNEILYGSDSPWARSPEYATIDAITRDDLVAFHEAWFHPGNVMLGAWGDFDAGELADAIEEAFAAWQPVPGFVRPDSPPVIASDGEGVFQITKEDVTQSNVYLGHLGDVRLDDPDYPAITMMNEVFSGGFSGRLMKSVRVEQGLAYAVGGGYSANYDRPGAFNAVVMTKSESTVEAAEAVLREVKKMREAPPDQEEVDLARDGYLNRFVFNFDTRGEVVNRMMTYDWYGYPADFLQQQKDALEAVTPADVHAVSQKYLKPDDIKILVVGKPDEFDQPLTALGNVTEVDITIPTGEEPVAEASTEDLESGRALLMAAREALGGEPAFGTLEGIALEGSQSLTTPDGQTVNMGLKMTIGLPDRIRLEQETPMGDVVITKNAGGFGFPAMFPEQMHGQIRGQVMASVWQNVVYFLAQAETVEAQQLADAEFSGQTAKVVLITPVGSDSFRLYLDPENSRPLGISYQQGPVALREVFGDFRDVGAFTLPYSVQVFDGDLPAAQLTYETIEINPALDATLFQQ